MHPGRCGAQAATRPTRQKQMRPRQNPKQSRRGGMTASPTALRLPRRGRRPRRPAVTASADPTAFHRPPPGRGMVSRYIMRHMARFPPAVGVGVLDDPFLRPPPAPRRRARAAGGLGRPQRGNPRRGFPLYPLLRFFGDGVFRALRRAARAPPLDPARIFVKKRGKKLLLGETSASPSPTPQGRVIQYLREADTLAAEWQLPREWERRVGPETSRGSHHPISVFLWGSTPFLWARPKKWGGTGSTNVKSSRTKRRVPETHPQPAHASLQTKACHSA